MADNRISLRCKVCGAEYVLAKRLGGPYYRSHVFGCKSFDKFMKDHEACFWKYEGKHHQFSIIYEDPQSL